MSSASNSTTSLLSGTRSTSSKNFDSALAELQSTYGAYGYAPMLPAKRNNFESKKYKQDTKHTSSGLKESHSSSRVESLGDLQAKYGLAGGKLTIIPSQT